MDLFTAGYVDKKRITAEVCVHHLWFTDADYDHLGALIKCNPAIKTADDRAALRQAIKDGRIDIIATDHAPQTWDEKQGTYFNAPSGLPLVQYALPALFDLVKQNVLNLTDVVTKTSHAVAQRYGMVDRGFIREGYWADLVLVDWHHEQVDTPEHLAYQCGWSPFHGHAFSSRIDATIVNGHIAYNHGETLHKPAGMRLQFMKNRR